MHCFRGKNQQYPILTLTLGFATSHIFKNKFW